MKTITVSASKTYNVLIGRELLRSAGDLAGRACQGPVRRHRDG